MTAQLQTAPHAAEDFRAKIDGDDALARLLRSSQELSYDPEKEIDWTKDPEPGAYGLNPEWSTLFGTPLWKEMSEDQRVQLTRHEVGSIMQTGIWFEMILQQMILRDLYLDDPKESKFQFGLTEVADECRHSIMFAKTAEKFGVPKYIPIKPYNELARGLKTIAWGELSYGAILVAEEILDVMQRDWMRGENVSEFVRTTSKIHVVEEARHMAFARHEIRENLERSGAARRLLASKVIAIAAYVITDSLVHDDVYKDVGLDQKRAIAEAKNNSHHHNLMRLSCIHLMDFLSECRLLNRVSTPWYRAAHML